MRKRVGAIGAGSVVLAFAWFWTLRAAPQRERAGATPPPVSLLVTLGEKATQQERWDGSVAIENAALLRVEGWHFSENDGVTSPASWRATTRRDFVAPYADLHYTEMRPGSVPEVRHYPVGVILTLQPRDSARVKLDTALGSASFALSDVGAAPLPLLAGRVTVAAVPAPEKLSTPAYEDDEPSIAALSDDSLTVAWVAYRGRADRVLLRRRSPAGDWSEAEEVTPKPADIFRCSVVSPAPGSLWVIWSERDGEIWNLWAREKRGNDWSMPVRLSAAGSSTFHRASTAGGRIFVAWQSFRGGQSDIYLKVFDGGRWMDEVRVSESPTNDWEPSVAAGADGRAYIAWDSYDRGNYDIFFRAWEQGRLGPVRAVTSSPKFQAHASVAVDAIGRPWVAWNESGVNWGKDQGFLIPTPLATPLHQQRALRVAVWDSGQWREPEPLLSSALPAAMRQNAEHPQLLFDGAGALRMIYRHWTRQQSRSIGSGMMWENYEVAFDGAQWSAPRLLSHSAGSIEKIAALARDGSGALWAAWMTDERPFATMQPRNAEVYVASLGSSRGASVQARLKPMVDPEVEAIPAHDNETADVRAIRGYTIDSGAARYRIYRGDMHRHTDVSQDFKYDGSLLEVYRYGLDAAGFDYIAPTDHQTGFDQEFTWWQNEKLVDLFHVPGAFTPLFGTERSLPYPNGHRNVIYAHRGVRPLPIPPEEMAGKTGAGKLFEYVRKNGGITMPHSSATSQGTDWRDNDPEVEPLVEIYQGYRTSYEYEGAPRSATTLNPQAQKSGWEPAGFWWNALMKGYRLGVQSSSDHWSTHISYACILAERQTRDGLLDAMKRRHAYAATDNIILDFQARAGGVAYLMGDAFVSGEAPALRLHAIGTGVIKRVDLIRDCKFVYTSSPGVKETNFEFSDRDFTPGKHWYYVRVLQEDGQMAWSSPIWVEKR